ncbi:hypothetical protein CEXT_80141 [Caerostris extrusa]|uniref:Uncharacterized protein n=1 Tax=Caerostris extrusa TaxID=172846 RepID=A0AAV4NEK9_CAEEX|nr:hypothetical protein CEXT_80141 [Caerostris extrusa]
MIEAPEPKLPPIMVRYTDNLKDQIAEISNQFEDDVRIKLAGEQLKIFPANSDIHRAITKYFTDGKIEFYVITPKNQRPLKAVLKGVPVSYSADEIATGLAELGLKIDQVRQLTNLKTKAPIPVWQIVYRKAPENNKIFEALSLYYKYLHSHATCNLNQKLKEPPLKIRHQHSTPMRFCHSFHKIHLIASKPIDAACFRVITLHGFGIDQG